MPDNSQSETCVEKPMKTLHKTNFFRIHLSAKDATREKPFADVSFYLNKTHIFEDQLVYRTRPTNRKIGLTGLTGPSSFFVFYHTQKTGFREINKNVAPLRRNALQFQLPKNICPY